MLVHASKSPPAVLSRLYVYVSVPMPSHYLAPLISPLPYRLCARSDEFSRANVEPPRKIGVPGPASIEHVRRGHEVRVDEGLAVDPVVGGAVQALATTTHSMVVIRAGYEPDYEVSGACPIDSPGSFDIQAVYFGIAQRIL